MCVWQNLSSLSGYKFLCIFRPSDLQGRLCLLICLLNLSISEETPRPFPSHSSCFSLRTFSPLAFAVSGIHCSPLNSEHWLLGPPPSICPVLIIMVRHVILKIVKKGLPLLHPASLVRLPNFITSPFSISLAHPIQRSTMKRANFSAPGDARLCSPPSGFHS